ncbi:MAG: macro domain-containing protein [Candidatus Korarchaeota archaeon NZ13-K]|nr:MAG: macro domain-containing protein [Candidatus Korarchaeota archaeon NZ13-K]
MPKVILVLGDITEIEADAIVNPANTLLIMGGGVAGAIKRRGGEEIEREALRKAPVRIGEAVETSAGRLKARYIIHAPTVESPGGASSPEYVRAAVRASIKRGVELGIRSIAFPAMGAGVGGVPVEESVRIILEETSASPFEKVLVVTRSKEDFLVFQRVASEMGVSFELLGS